MPTLSLAMASDLMTACPFCPSASPRAATERCVIRLIDGALVVTEVAPGLDVQRDVLDQAATELKVAQDLKVMDDRLFAEGLMQLELAKA